MKYKPLALAAAAVVAGFLSFGGAAQAATLMTGSGAPAGVTRVQDANMQMASHRYRYFRHSNRHHRWRGHRSGIFLGLGLAPFFYSPYYAQPYYYGAPTYYAPARSSRHVRWCLDRYRTYDPRSNTFRGFDGDRHRCRSPYRY